MSFEKFCLKLGITKYYKSIKIMPKSVWNEITETANFDLMLNRGYLTKESKRDMWRRLQNEYLVIFGVQKDYQKLMKLRFDRLKLMSQYLSTGDKNYLQRIIFLDADIEKEEAKFTGTSTQMEMYGWLTKQMGHINLNKISVYEYDSILNYNIKQHREAANG